MSHQKLSLGAVGAVFAALFLSACNDAPGNLNGGVVGPDGRIVTGGSSICSGMNTSDRSNYCLALKYVAYTDSAGAPTISQSAAISAVEEINRLWSSCGIAFGIEEYQAVKPSDHGLSYSPAGMGELTTIRSDFQDSRTLLVVTTGVFSSVSADAWTQMPPSGPFGAIIGGEVASYAPVIAHELGHYLSLDHVSDANDLMNPIVYGNSTNLYSSQCSTARDAVISYWTSMLRV